MPTRRRRLPIVRLGDPILRQVAAELPLEELRNRQFQRFVDDLLHTMRRAEGVGLAAPQVGVSARLFAWGALPEIAEQVVINPVVEATSHATIDGWEGCLSIPGLRGRVPRFRRVRLRGFDRLGEPIDLRVSGYEARIVQHELDHLDGVVFLDRMSDLSSLGFDDEVERAEAAADEGPRGA